MQRGLTSIVMWCLGLLLLAPTLCLAETDPARLEAGRKATAFVFSQFEKSAASGSAFCIDSSGLFVTNHHVVNADGKTGIILIVTSPGTRAAKILPATVVAQDEKLDLAILKVKDAGTLSALPLASPAQVSRLRETQEVMALGYPEGFKHSVDPYTTPEISINMGKITALRHKDGTLVRIQFDGKINHGNSGGPLLDSRGNVIGFVTLLVEATEINYAYPVTFLHYFLAKSNIVLTPRSLLDAEEARGDIKRLNQPPPAGRSAVPIEAAVNDAAKLLHELFAERYKDKTAKGRAQLVLELVDHLGTAKNDVSGRYVMLTEARTTAMTIGDIYSALYLSELLAEEYELSKTDLLTEVISKPLLGEGIQQKATVAAAIGLLTAEAAGERHAYPQALKLVPTIKSLAYRTQNPAAISSVTARVARIEAQAVEFEQGTLALQKLKNSPNDPAANLAAGRYHTFVMGDFSNAMHLFAKGSDANLQAIARVEQAKPSKALEQKSLADLWWDQAAREKTNLAAGDACKERAGFWYRQSEGGLNGLAKAFVEQRLATFAATQPVDRITPSTRPVAKVVDLLARTDPARDTIDGNWHLEKRGLLNEPAKAAELRFAYQPPAEYDYCVEYTRTDGQWGAGLILCHGGKIFTCSLPSERSHAVYIDPPIGATLEEVRSPLPATTASGCKVCVQVRKDGVTLIVDDKKMLSYRSAGWEAGDRPDFLRSDPVALGMVVFYGRMEIKSAQVTEITTSDESSPKSHP